MKSSLCDERNSFCYIYCVFDFQWLLHTPNATTFFGCVSKDKFGGMLEDKARALGVNVQFQFTDKEPTGTCAVIVTGDYR